jgi:hypothetical protein
MGRYLRVNAGTGTINSTKQDVTVIRFVTAEAAKRNWPWLCAYGISMVAVIVASFFFSGWVSVAVSAFVDVLSMVVALVMIQDVIMIANDTGWNGKEFCLRRAASN